MDPVIQAFLDRLDATLTAHMAAIQASTARIDEIVAWRPDLEHRVADLGGAVAALQQAHQSPPAPSNENGKAGTAPTLQHATHGLLPKAGAGAAGVSQGSVDRGDVLLPRGPPAASFMTPPPLPANGQLDSFTPFLVPSPLTHASQLLAGLGQAHPSVVFPVFFGEHFVSSISKCSGSIHRFGYR